MRFSIIAICAALLFLAPAGAQENSLVLQEGVVYDTVYGNLGSGTMSVGPGYDGADLLEFEGCSYAKFRDDLARGRAQVIGGLPGGAVISVDMVPTVVNESEPIKRDALVDGTEDHSTTQHPEVTSYIVAYATANLAINHEPYLDPMTGTNEYSGSYLVTKQGFRDDLMGGIIGPTGTAFQPGDAGGETVSGDWETHFRIQGKGGTNAGVSSATFEEPPGPAGGPARFTRNVEYQALHPIFNSHFGGEMTIDFAMTSEAPEGQNEVELVVRAPDGLPYATLNFAPYTLNDAVESVTVPLDQFGTYVLEVKGEVVLSQYTIDVQQVSDGPLDLWFWWEDLHFGVEAMGGYADCQATVGSASPPAVAFQMERDRPPALILALVAFGIVGTLTLLLVGVKLVGQNIADSQHRSTTRK